MNEDVTTNGGPDAIPVAREADYRTDTIGQYDGGQYYAAIHGAVRGEPTLGAPSEDVRWYAYVHRFDASGAYQSSDIEFIKAGPYLGLDSDRAEAALESMLEALPGRTLGDITMRPFRTVFDGVLFGLIDESDERDGQPWFELYPDRLGFTEPWDGLYSTEPLAGDPEWIMPR